LSFEYWKELGSAKLESIEIITPSDGTTGDIGVYFYAVTRSGVDDFITGITQELESNFGHGIIAFQ
jgi:hypothetical protein